MTARRGPLALLLLAACGEPGDRIVVVAYDAAAQEYALEPQQFQTLRDVRALEGEVTTILAGAEFVIDAYAASAPTLEEALDRAVREEGNAVKFSAVQSEGAWLPTDYHSLGMATVYRNIERAVAHFENLGVDFDELGSIPTYYFLTFAVQPPGGERVEATDNAAYSLIPGLDGFIVLEQDFLEDLPLGMNLGVMVHEYGHALMARFRHGTPPVVDVDEIVDEACVRSMIDEGTSDYFGAFATGDSNFIRFSIPRSLVDRDLAVVRELTEGQVEESVAKPCDPEVTDPHLVGAIWAALLWAIGEDVGHDLLGPAVVRALRAFAVHAAPTLATLPDLLVAELEPVDRPAACARIAERFAPVASAVGSCP